MPHGCCRTWCGHSRAITPCLSSSCYHDIVISTQISLSPSTSGTVGVSSLRRRDRLSHTADRCYSLVVIQNIPDEPPKAPASYRVRRVRPGGASGGYRASKSCLGDFFGSSPCSRCSRLLVRYTLDCISRARPLRHPTAFLTTRAFYRSDSGPP